MGGFGERSYWTSGLEEERTLAYSNKAVHVKMLLKCKAYKVHSWESSPWQCEEATWRKAGLFKDDYQISASVVTTESWHNWWLFTPFLAWCESIWYAVSCYSTWPSVASSQIADPWLFFIAILSFLLMSIETSSNAGAYFFMGPLRFPRLCFNSFPLKPEIVLVCLLVVSSSSIQNGPVRLEMWFKW
jgi:hypothetical protein